MFKIIDEARELITINEDGTITVLKSFYDINILKDRKYTLYAYVDIVDDKLYVKFGEAKKQSIYDRYHRGTATKANDRMIGIWESDKGDKEIHAKLKQRAKNNRGYQPATTADLNTVEAYYIESERGLENLLNDIAEYAKAETLSTRIARQDYKDVVDLVQLVLSYNKEKYILDLCTRFGKTGTFCLLWKELNKTNVRIHILASYVGTVKTSYSKEINTLENNKNCLFIDPDIADDETVKQMKAWLKNPEHYICYYVALTGDQDTCFERRISLLNKFKNYDKSLSVEEADFGAGCDKQIKKLKHLYETKSNHFKLFFATTGTKAEKCERIIEPEVSIKRDYILDVLNKRPNAVGINWYCLNNEQMVKYFNYVSSEMENFSDMFTVENSHLKGELWFRDVLDFLFNKNLPVMSKEARKYRNHSLLNEAVTLIYTPIGNAAQQVFRSLVEEVVGRSYWVKVINGDETTNAKAEEEVLQAIRDQGTRGILIASAMANRSFSVPQIKNEILFTNSGFVDQKIARVLTPWKGHPEMRGNIIDFRLAYEETSLSSYLSNLALDSLDDTATHNNTNKILEEIKASDKLAFYEYFANNVDPIRELTSDEIKLQMHSRPYQVARALKIITIGIDEIDMPTSFVNEPLDFNGLVNNNIKGDTNKKVKVNRTVREFTGKSKKQLEQDQRIQHLAYLLNHKDEFNSGKYEENILENEFKYNMSAARKQAIEECFGIDMKTMTQIANLLIKNGVKVYN